MNDKPTRTELLLNGVPYTADARAADAQSFRARWNRRLLVGILLIETASFLPKYAHGQFLSIFDSIFSSIQNDIGSSLSSINQVVQQTQKLYQTTLAPLAALNQARGFVANSINSFRGQMNQIFNTPFTSAVTPGPQQFESILHSRLSSEIPALQTSFTSNYGAIPQVNTASPQDRVMMDVDDALGQENLKTTLIADQGADAFSRPPTRWRTRLRSARPAPIPFSRPRLRSQISAARHSCKRCLRRNCVRRRAVSLTTTCSSSAGQRRPAGSTA